MSNNDGSVEDTDRELEFLCTTQISCGYTTNNIAEYTGVILALLFGALNRIDNVQVRSDSELLVKQIKGINVVRNVRLVYVVPIVHDLIKHFRSVQIDWIPRNMN